MEERKKVKRKSEEKKNPGKGARTRDPLLERPSRARVGAWTRPILQLENIRTYGQAGPTGLTSPGW